MHSTSEFLSFPRAARRLSLAGIALAVVAATAGSVYADNKFAEIRAAMQRQRDAVPSMRVEYDETVVPLIDEEVLFRHQGFTGAGGSAKYVEWFVGDRQFQQQFLEDKSLTAIMAALRKDEPKKPRAVGGQSSDAFFSKTDYAAFKKARDQTPLQKTDLLMAWDGARHFWRNSLLAPEDRRSWFIRGVPAQPTRYFLETYFDRIGWGRHDPGLPLAGILADRDRWPQALSEPGYALLAEPDVIDGVPCDVIESPNAMKLWLDPNRGYAVVRRHIWRDGQLAFEFEYADHIEATPGAWMPRRIEMYAIGNDKFPAEFVGKRTLHTTYAITRMEVNDPGHANLQTPAPEPGDFIQDASLPPLDENGQPMVLEPSPFNPPVSYRQPAEGVDPRPVIEEAQRKAGKRVMDLRRSGKLK